MPVVPSSAKVLVTGASGFLATHVVTQLLQDGYQVIGTVRSQEKGDYLINLYDNYRGQFSFVIVPDIEKEDAFDEAVKGVDGVVHTASPFHFLAEDPKELIGPAVSGTVGILKSIAKNAPTVKRVVITASAASIITPKDKPYAFTEADWNDHSPAIVEKLGAKAPQGDKYRASKTLAEKAAWEYVEKNKELISFDLVVMNPPFIFGPPIHEISSISALNESNAQFVKAIKTVPPQENAVAFMGGFIDVRDIALAHSRALQKEEAGGQRFFVTSASFSWQDVYNTLREARIANIPEGYPSALDPSKYHTQDSSKAKRILEIKEFRPLQETLVDTINSIRARFPGSV